jgi:hypothetical protein
MPDDAAAPLATLLERARTGEALAMRLLGERFLVGQNAPYHPARGGGLVRMAAEGGDLEARAFMSVLAALGVGQSCNWSEAITYLRAAADAGHDGARGQIAALGAWLDDPGRMLRVAEPTPMLQAPRVAVLKDFLPPSVCAWLVARAAPRLSRARVFDPGDGGSRALDIRTNAGMGFAFLQTDLVLQIVHARIAAALALPIMHQEPTNILHYRPGEYYRPHYDFLDPAEATFATSLKRSGQRVATLLIYLNADYEGGETDFPRAAWRFKGAPGDALMFFNVTPDGRPDPMTLHAGLPPIVGEKWLLSKWVRDRALPLI